VDSFDYIGCEGDGFKITFNDKIYNESNPNGKEEMLTEHGCDSLITVSLLFAKIEECNLFLPNIISKDGINPNN